MMEFLADNWAFIAIGALVVLYFGRELWVSTDKGRLRAYVAYENKDVSRHIVKREFGDKGEFFVISGKAYRIDQRFIYRTGFFRVPTSFYQYGKADPRAFERNKEDELSAIQYKQAVKNTVVTQLIKAFQQPIISQEVSLILIAGLIVGGMGFLWYQMDQSFTQLQQVIVESSRAVGSK